MDAPDLLNREVVWLEGERMEGNSWSSLSPESRAWLYSANRVLTAAEQVVLRDAIEQFMAEWVAHGKSLLASWCLEGGRCLVIALDERSPNATGCSIDAKVHWLQALGEKLDVDWMTRNSVMHFNAKDAKWYEMSLAAFWAARKAKAIDDETLVVNAVISKKHECDPTLVCSFKASWHESMWR